MSSEFPYGIAEMEGSDGIKSRMSTALIKICLPAALTKVCLSDGTRGSVDNSYLRVILDCREVRCPPELFQLDPESYSTPH